VQLPIAPFDGLDIWSEVRGLLGFRWHGSQRRPSTPALRLSLALKKGHLRLVPRDGEQKE